MEACESCSSHVWALDLEWVTRSGFSCSCPGQVRLDDGFLHLQRVILRVIVPRSLVQSDRHETFEFIEAAASGKGNRLWELPGYRKIGEQPTDDLIGEVIRERR